MIVKIGAGIVLYFFIMWGIFPILVTNSLSYIESVKISHLVMLSVGFSVGGFLLLLWSLKVLLG
jgi:nitrate reductase NapE component